MLSVKTTQSVGVGCASLALSDPVRVEYLRSGNPSHDAESHDAYEPPCQA